MWAATQVNGGSTPSDNWERGGWIDSRMLDLPLIGGGGGGGGELPIVDKGDEKVLHCIDCMHQIAHESFSPKFVR